MIEELNEMVAQSAKRDTMDNGLFPKQKIIRHTNLTYVIRFKFVYLQKMYAKIIQCEIMKH